jgi:hypothetical protein
MLRHVLACGRYHPPASLPPPQAPVEIALRGKSTIVCFGDGTNPGVLRASGVVAPRAIFITYGEHERCVSATMRHRVAFPDAPIYVRATTKAEVRRLHANSG